MSKKLKIQFWRAKLALAMQILEQEGLPERKVNDFIKIISMPCMCRDELSLRGYDTEEDFFVDVIYFSSNTERDEYLQKAVNAITDELFTGKSTSIAEWDTYPAEHISWSRTCRIVKRIEPTAEECGQLVTYTWEEK